MADTAPAAAAAGAGAGADSKVEDENVLTQPCVCPGHQKDITEIHFSTITPEGVFFVSACADKAPMLRNGSTGDWIGTFEGHKGAVWSAKLNKSATAVATGSADWSAKLWDAITGAELATWEHKHVVKTVDFHPSETHLVTGGNDKLLRVFDVRATDKDPIVIEHGAKICRALYSLDGKQIITGGDDGVVRVWDMASNTVAKEIKLASAIKDLELSATQGMLTIASGKQVTVLDASTFDVKHSHTMEVELNSVSLHPTEPRFVVGGSEVWMRMYNLHSGAEMACNKGHHGPVFATRWHPKGHMYASGSNDATIRLWPKDLGVTETAK